MLFCITETKHDGSSTGRGAQNEDARTECRNTATNGSFVQWKRASDSRNCHTSWYDKGEHITIYMVIDYFLRLVY